MEGFTKEVLMMWREALDGEGGKCTALKAGKRGIPASPSQKKQAAATFGFVCCVNVSCTRAKYSVV